MRMRSLALAALLVVLALITTSRPASAQGLASIAAASVATGSMEKTPGCWGCATMAGLSYCAGGYSPGYFNCVGGVTCTVSSPGCGAGASLPVDLDGASQYVSRGSLLGVPVAYQGGPAVKRNCEGVVVARTQSPDDITAVRIRTGLLSL
jgi:hypothetical protein